MRAELDEPLRDAVNCLAEGFSLFDAEDRLVLHNQRVAEFYPSLAAQLVPGTTYEALLRAMVKGGLVGEAAGEEEEWIDERMELHRAGRGPPMPVRRSGRWLQIRERRTAEGGSVVVQTDVSELVVRREELTHQTLLLHTTLESLNQGIAVFDRDLKLLLINQRCLKMLDYPEALKRPGTPFADFVRHCAEHGEYGPGEVEAQIRERIERARQGEPYRLERTRPNGTMLEIDVHPMPGGGFVSIHTDTTQHRRSTEAQAAVNAALVQRNRQLDIALGNMTQGLTVYDGRQRLMLWNRRYAELYGLPSGGLHHGMPLRKIMELSVQLGNYDAARGTEIIEERLAVAASGQRRVFYQRLAGSRVIEVIHQPLADGGSVDTFTEVSQRERTEQALLASEERLRDRVRELEETRQRLERQSVELSQLADSLARARDDAQMASRTKSEFLATISHELRTPLNAIIGFSEVMKDELFGPIGQARYRDYACDVHESGRHLLAVINDILDMAKIESGRLDLHEEVIVLATLTADCIRLMRERSEQAGLGLDLVLTDGLPRLRADPIKLKQIILNLLSNAVKFTSSGGRIKVSAESLEDGGIVIAVTDTGTGMRPEDIPLALQPFRQVDTVLSRRHSGTGLGLPLSKALVELHGGQLVIESRLGVGTTVSVRLPYARVVAEPDAPPIASAAGA
ncbi:MAG: PAS-domain containing protein [Proteobacteria bacterium]|nr:PAS-domain containing protein [Pseudomonadota bacterium]